MGSSPIPESPQTPSSDKVAGAGIWVILGYGTGQGMRLVSNLILTRLLVPEFFGVMALVHSIMYGLCMLSDVGTAQTLVRTERGDDPDFLATLWTAQIIRGAVGWVAILLVAPFLARLYERPEVFYLLAVTGFCHFLGGFISIGYSRLERDLERKKLTMIDQGCQLVGTCAAIAWAIAWPSIWALAIGQLVDIVLRVTISFVVCPGAPARLRWEPSAVRELVSFGGWICLSSSLTFLSRQSDRLLAPYYFSFSALGFLSIAATLAQIPRIIGQSLSAAVLFPFLSRLAKNEQAFREAVDRYKVLSYPALFCVASILCVAGDALVDILYDSRYSTAGVYLQILAVGVPLAIVVEAGKGVILSIGRSRQTALLEFIRLVIFVPALVGAGKAGLDVGIVGANVAADCAQFAALAVIARRYDRIELKTDYLYLVGFGMSIFLGWAVSLGLSQHGACGLGMKMALSMGTLVAFWVVVLFYGLRRVGLRAGVLMRRLRTSI